MFNALSFYLTLKMPHIPVISPSIFSFPLSLSPFHAWSLLFPTPPVTASFSIFSSQGSPLNSPCYLIFFFPSIVWDYGCGSFEQMNDVFHFTFAKNQFALRNWGKKAIMRNVCNFWKEINGFDQTDSWNKNGFWMLNLYWGVIEYGYKNAL